MLNSFILSCFVKIEKYLSLNYIALDLNLLILLDVIVPCNPADRIKYLQIFSWILFIMLLTKYLLELLYRIIFRRRDILTIFKRRDHCLCALTKLWKTLLIFKYFNIHFSWLNLLRLLKLLRTIFVLLVKVKYFPQLFFINKTFIFYSFEQKIFSTLCLIIMLLLESLYQTQFQAIQQRLLINFKSF